jgi:hypothetical protein
MTTPVDSHIQALRDLLVADLEESIAQAQARADAAAARGDEFYRKWHQDEADRLRAKPPFPWQMVEAS